MSSRMPDAGSMCSGQPGATADSSSMPSNTPTREPARVGMHAEIRDTGGAVGRGLFATRALGPGTLIAVEKPYVWKLPLTTTSSSAESSDRSGFCHQCLAPSVQLKRCGACKGPMYCSTPCQKAAWRGHKVECAAIQRVAPHIPPSALMLMASVLQTGDGVVAAQIAGLKGSADDLDNTAKEEITGLIVMLKRFLPEGDLPEPRAAFDLLSKLRCNTFSICDPELQTIGAAVYPQLSAVNHSCSPNCAATFRGTTLQLRATTVIEPGTELTIAYVDVITPRRFRLAALREQYAFTCTCPRCTAPRDAGGILASDFLLEAVRCDGCGEVVTPTRLEGNEAIKCECGNLVAGVDDAALTAAGSSVPIPAPGTAEARAELTALQRRVAIWDSQLGDTHMLRIRGYQRLADLLIGAEEWNAALRAVAAAVAGMEQVVSPDSPTLALERVRLGKLQHYLGHCRIAANTLAMGVRALGVSHGTDTELVAGLAHAATEAAREAMSTPLGVEPPKLAL
eukprot:m.237081 g.237081  ORF g.237081 m.237081 type:complete len:510 (-) comp26200_c0_seq1:118-1647(-)